MEKLRSQVISILLIVSLVASLITPAAVRPTEAAAISSGEEITTDAAELKVEAEFSLPENVIKIHPYKDKDEEIAQISPLNGGYIYARKGEPGIYSDLTFRDKIIGRIAGIDEARVKKYGEPIFVWEDDSNGQRYAHNDLAKEFSDSKIKIEDAVFTKDTNLKLHFEGYIKTYEKEEGLNTKQVRYDRNGNLTVVWELDEKGNRELMQQAGYNEKGSLIWEKTALGYTKRYEYEDVTDEKGKVTGQRVVKIIYDDGTSDTYDYDAKGRIRTHVNPDGTDEEFGYDGYDRVVQHSIYDHTGQKKLQEVITHYEEKPIGNRSHGYDVTEIETIIDTITGAVSEKTTQYRMDGPAYEKLANLDKEAKEESKEEAKKQNITTLVEKQRLKDGSFAETRRVVYEYSDGCIRKITEDGKITELEYNGYGELTHTKTYREGAEDEIIESSYMVSKHYEDDDYKGIKEITETDIAGAIRIYKYDKDGNMTSYRENGNNATFYEYNKQGNITKIITPMGYEISYEYNGRGKLSKITDAEGGETYLSYDKDGRLTEEKELEDGKVIRYHSYEYDCKDRVTAEKDIKGKIIARYTYDNAGNIIVYEDAKGNRTEWTYDELGRVLSEKDASGAVNYNVYDEKGNLIETRDARGSVAKIEYDDFGNIIKTTDREGNEVTFVYDAKGRHISTTQGQNVTTVGYDERGNLAKVTEANGAITESEYNKKGNVIYTKDAAGGEEHREYDEIGNLKSVTDALGNRTEYIYNDENKCLFKIEYMDQAPVRKTRYSYDGLGNLTEVLIKDGEYKQLLSRTVIKYDAAGRIIKEGIAYSEEGEPENNISYEYDEKGRLLKKIYEDGISYSKYEYDANGNMTREIYVGSDGKTCTYSYRYNVNNQLISTTNPMGVTTAYTYTPVGMIETEAILDDGGNPASQIEYIYDKNDNVVQVRENGKVKEQYEYDEAGRVSEYKDANENVTSYTYDETGNLIKVSYPDGGEENYIYDYLSRVTFAEDAAKAKLGYIYDANGNVIVEIDKRGYIYLNSYDELGRKELSVLADEESKAEYVYDEEGRVTAVKTDDRTLATYSYSEKGKLIAAKATEEYERIIREEEEEDKDVVRYYYDLLDRLIRVVGIDKVETIYEYDASGRVSKESIKAPGEEERLIAGYEYDIFDRVTTSTDSRGVSREYEYDSLGNMIKYKDGLNQTTEYEYDMMGNLMRETGPQGQEQGYSYDHLSRLTSQTDPNGNAAGYEYDESGNLVKEIDRNSNVTEYMHDKNGNVVKTIDPSGTISILDYDSMNRVTGIRIEKEKSEEGADLYIAGYEYDKRGLLTKETNALGQHRSYEYDEAGNLVKTVNEAKEVTRYAYNYMNLVESITYHSGETVKYEYDIAGNMTAAKKGKSGISIQRDYLGRVTKVTDEKQREVGYKYDEAGNVTEITYPEGETVSYSYDSEGRLKEITDSVLGTTTIIHDDKNRTVSKNYGNGEKTVYKYDAAGNVVRMSEYLKDQSLYMDVEYTYDANQNRTKESYKVFEGARGKDAAPVKETTYMYDGLNRLIARRTTEGTIVYEYDRLSNLVMEDNDGEVTKYSYNKLNQLIEKQSKEGVTTYSYDVKGNRIREEGSRGVKEYTYDITGRLKKGVNETGEISLYEYNPLGIRTKHTSITKGQSGVMEETITEYVADYLGEESNDLVSYTVHGLKGYAARYTYAGSERIGQTVKEETLTIGGVNIKTTGYNVHEDIMGSVSYTTNYKDGKIYQKAEYDVWGRPTITGDKNNKFFELNYTGHSYDEILSMYYAQARFYDPVNKVFGSMDPAKYGTNWYSYCSANPVTYYDPTGLYNQEHLINEFYETFDDPIARTEFFVNLGVIALEIVIGMVVPGAIMVIAGAGFSAIQSGFNYLYETTETGEIYSDKEMNRRILRGAVEGLIMGAGGMACVKATEALSILKPISKDCNVNASTLTQKAEKEASELKNLIQDPAKAANEAQGWANLSKRFGISAAGNTMFGVVADYAGNLVEGKSMKEAYEETLSNASSILISSLLTSTVDVVVQKSIKPKCFVAGTPVLTEEGNVNIQDIKEGDLVFAYDEETGKTGYKEVVRLFRNIADELVHVTILTEGGKEETITSTLDHPYYVKEKDAFVDAQDLEEGTVLMLADGTAAEVVKVNIEKLETPVAVYNFEVKDFHTYYVGGSSVLVHNSGCGEETSGDSEYTVPQEKIKGRQDEAVRSEDYHRFNFTDAEQAKNYVVKYLLGKTYGVLNKDYVNFGTINESANGMEKLNEIVGGLADIHGLQKDQDMKIKGILAVNKDSTIPENLNALSDIWQKAKENFKSNTGAMMAAERGFIFLNEEKIKLEEVKYITSKDSYGGYPVTTSLRGAIYHERMHVLDYQNPLNPLSPFALSNSYREGVDGVVQWKDGQPTKEIGNMLSEYAMTNPREFVAEYGTAAVIDWMINRQPTKGFHKIFSELHEQLGKYLKLKPALPASPPPTSPPRYDVKRL